MAIAFVGAASAAANSLSMPTHQAGDLLIAFAYNAGATATLPTVPTGWVSQSSQVQNNGRSGVIAYRTADSSAVAFGTWTDATHVAVAVYRSNSAVYLFIGATTSFSALSAATITYAQLNAANMIRGGSAWVLAFSGTTTDDVANTPPGAMVNRTATASSGEIAIHDTNANVSSWATTTVATTSVTYRTFGLEIYETDIAIASGSGGGLYLPRGMRGGFQ